MEIVYSAKLLTCHLQRGEDFTLRLGTATQPNTDDTGAAVNYAGCTFLSQIRDSTDAIIATATISAIAVGQLKLLPIKTAAWSVGDLFFDIKMTDAANAETWVLRRSVIRVTDQVSTP